MKNTKILKLLLAAGRSNRFGSQNKLLELLNGKKVIEHTVENLLKIFNKKEILVVTGYQVNEIELSLKKYEIKTSYNSFYYKGIGTSISHAITINKLNLDGIMIIPADMPLITTLDYKKIIKGFVSNNLKKIICPKYKNSEGNPLILPKKYFEILKSLKGDEGAKKFLPKENFLFIKTGPGTTFDIDNIQDLKKAELMIEKKLQI
tara:strand:+ start:58 stop:672 length:615 start_codon:yes stop_codon:yes gene_type:complete